MSKAFQLAWQYVCHHKVKSAVLIFSIVLTILLPVTIKILLWQFNQKVLARADETPAVVGPVGSDLDLALNATYFRHNPQAKPIPFSEVETIQASELAKAIPIHSRFTAQQFKVVGTSLDYFRYRQLQVSIGGQFATLGDCVLGAQVAKSLNLTVGDQLLSDREDVIGFGGVTPLKMNVAGILGESRSPDDWAVFVDLKTAWVIEGLGHGHEDLSNESEDSVKILKQTDKEIIASAGVVSFLEITDANIGSFHFHGDTSEFPVTAIIVDSPDVKSETILQGRFQAGSAEAQFTRPGKVMRELMQMVFRINQFFDANAMMIALSTAMLLALVVMLSLKLRSREMETMFRIGCSRGTIALLQIGELMIIFAFAALITAGLVWLVWINSASVVESLLVG
ncbi:MAG: ABC transporter permease [Planctomycetota bacterium]